MKTTLVHAAVMLAVSMSVGARELSPPTDTDLKASYCLAVQQEGASHLNAIDASELPASAVPYFQKGMAGIRERIRHLQQYLLPRLEYVDPMGLIAARERGTEDANYIAQDTQVMACSAKCASQARAMTDEQYGQCTATCAPEQMTRIRQCLSLSWLPF
ncbi:hypothetical protein P0D88_33225 [Paraburkholderia sp. RL18-103-BIB-C]|uniref:hypothetical protein n=1 Tax=Paraburkholderia sp. RL18-103-BIB-C TaxID=3031637 RepID=UPI0038BB715A